MADDKWTLCCKKMPEIGNNYLVTYVSHIDDGSHSDDSYGRPVVMVDVATYHPQAKLWERDLTSERIYPVAWMPMPEPYDVQSLLLGRREDGSI